MPPKPKSKPPKKKLTRVSRKIGWHKLAPLVGVCTLTLRKYAKHEDFPKDDDGKPTRDIAKINLWVAEYTRDSNYIASPLNEGETSELPIHDENGKIILSAVRARKELAIMQDREINAELSGIELRKAKLELIEYPEISKAVQLIASTLKNDFSQIGKKSRQDLHHYLKSKKDSHLIEEIVQDLVDEASMKAIDNLINQNKGGS